jgi:hypothetical protein
MEKTKFIRNNEDWWALWIGLFVFVVSLGTLLGRDPLGWGIATRVWLDISKAMAPVSKAYEGMSGFVALLLTYLFMLVIMGVGAKALKFNLKEFAIGFTVIFWVSYGCWLIGNWAYIAATPNQLKLHRGPPGGPDPGQLLPGGHDLPQGGYPPRVVHQDGHRDPRGLPGGAGRRSDRPGQSGHVPGLRGDR